MTDKNMMVVARNKEEESYHVVCINDYKLETAIVSYEQLKAYIMQDRVINYEFNSELNTIEYTQGSESRLDITKDSDTRVFIVERLVKNTKTLGFNVLLIVLNGYKVGNKNLWRLTYEDTLKLMHKYNCINAKKSDTERKISALKGNFREREIRDSKYKPNETLVNNIIKSVDWVSKDDNTKESADMSDRQRLKEYNKLYSDYMIASNGEILEKYAKEPTMKIIKNQLENGRYKNNIKRTLAMGLAIAAIGSIGGNVVGVVNYMPENRIQVNKSVESPKSKAQAIAMMEAANKITVDYNINYTNGTVYADGVKVANIKSKAIPILNNARLETLDGETISDSEQKVSLFGNFSLINADDIETTVKGQFHLFNSNIDQKDSKGNTISKASLNMSTFKTKGYILDAEGNKCYEITKEPFGKTFTIEKIGNSEMNNSDALMLTSLLSIKSTNDSRGGSSNSKSK